MRNAEPEPDVSKAESGHVLAIGVGGTWKNCLPVTYVTSDRRWDIRVLILSAKYMQGWTACILHTEVFRIIARDRL